MRTVWIVFLLVLAIPPAAAHGGSIAHVNPVRLDLAGHEERTLPIEFEEGNLRKDWVFVLNVIVTNGTGSVEIALIDSAGVIQTWTVNATGLTHHLTARVRETTTHSLVVKNPGGSPIQVKFFYDASCNCSGKPIPPDIPTGAVLFNVDPRRGDQFESSFPEPAFLNLTVTHAVRINEGSQWPDDFRILGTSTSPQQESGREVHRFSWLAERTERHYFWVLATSTDLDAFARTPPSSAVLGVYVDPEISRVGGDAPAPGLLLLLSATVGGVLLSRVGRR